MKRKRSIPVACLVGGSAVLVIAVLAITFDNVFDFLLALWSTLFVLILGVCVTAVIATLLYDYMIRK